MCLKQELSWFKDHPPATPPPHLEHGQGQRPLGHQHGPQSGQARRLRASPTLLPLLPPSSHDLSMDRGSEPLSTNMAPNLARLDGCMPPPLCPPSDLTP